MIKSFLVLFFKKELLSCRPVPHRFTQAGRVILYPGWYYSSRSFGIWRMRGEVLLQRGGLEVDRSAARKPSFLKKRSKRLLPIGARVAATRTYEDQKFFGAFF